VKASPKITADSPKPIGNRSNRADFGGRGGDSIGGKTVAPSVNRKSGMPDTGSPLKLGAADAGSRRDSPAKLDGVRKSDPVKSSIDRPNISDVRKRTADLPSAKSKPADPIGKADGSKPPAKGPIDLGKTSDVGKRTGTTPAGIDRAKMPGKGNVDPGKGPDVGRNAIHKPPGEFKPTAKVNTPVPGGVGKGKVNNDTIVRAQFSDRVKRGDFQALAKSPVGQKIKLADQYRLAQQGDVARRLALHKDVVNVTKVTHVTNVGGVHGFHHHPYFSYRGWVSPIYHRHCFEYRSWFCPAWYPSTWWYPRWSPWLHWSWHHHCHPFWDPRPLWCRPVIYVAVPQPWIAWNYPVWNPLPEVPSGTWVDVQKPVVPQLQYDLQLLAVRYVDPGHPDEKLGPRYRVWFRNNSDQPITKPFDVRLFATPGEQVAGNVPQAAVRVTAIEAGDTQSVDIRLPFDVAQAVGADGKAPFQFIHAMIDANREIQDTNQANNGARVAANEVLPVDPAAFEVDPKSVAAGGELVVAGEGLGPEPGKVILHLGNIEMEAEVLGWYDLGVRLKLPDLPLADATQADLVVIRGDGAATNPVAVTINPPQR